MTDTSKDKIRIEDYNEFDDVFTFTSDKLTPEEFKEFVGNQVKEKVREILFNTGEQHIHIEKAVLIVNCREDYNKDNSFDIKVHSEFIYLRLECQEEYESRLNQLKIEEAQLKQLATKFGYKLEKVNDYKEH